MARKRMMCGICTAWAHGWCAVRAERRMADARPCDYGRKLSDADRKVKRRIKR